MGTPVRRAPHTGSDPLPPERGGRRWRLRLLRGLAITLAVLLALVAVALLGVKLAEGPVKDYAQQQLNSRVEGYEFRIGGLALYPLTLSLELRDVEMRQLAHPDPPVGLVPRWLASLQWGALLRGRIVSDQHLERPEIRLDVARLSEGPKAEQAKAWQDVVLAVMPITLRELTLEGGRVTYVASKASAPVALDQLNVRMTEVRNVPTGPREYPSFLHVDGRVGGQGWVTVDGKFAPFTKPYPGVHADLRLEGVDLARLRPILSSYGLYAAGGRVGAVGHVEYSPAVQFAELERLAMDGVRADYVSTGPSRSAGQGAETAERAASAAGGGLVVSIKEGTIRGSEFGFVDKTAAPEYRLFLADTEAQLTNVSTRPGAGPGFVSLRGRFMGNGDFTLSGMFRPDPKGPNFDLNVRLEDVAIRSLNDLLRAYGALDVTKGRLSVFSELTVHDGQVEGYIKPLFRDVEVYARKQDRGKGVMQQLYEGVVGGVSGLLENEVREEVATQAELSGGVSDPQLSTWEAVRRLFRNAFVRAILPGFDREIGGGRRRG